MRSKLTAMCGLLALACTALALAASPACAQGTPHSVYVAVDNIDGLTPADGDLLFDAWLLARPAEAGDQSTFGWGYGMGLLSIECGNVFSTWTAGDVLHIEAEEVSTGYTGIGEYTLTYDNLQFFNGDDGLTLTPEPATLSLLALGGLALLRRRKM